jgi:hypothetical protein
MSKLIALINFCLLDYELSIQCKFCNYAIALSCIYIALEQLQWTVFLKQLKEYVGNTTTSDGLGFQI